MPNVIAQNLVAGVVRELRFVERALLADEDSLAAKHLITAADLLRASIGAVQPNTRPQTRTAPETAPTAGLDSDPGRHSRRV